MKNDIFIREYEPKDYRDLIQAGFPFSTAEWGSVYKDLKSKVVSGLERLEHKKFVAYSSVDKKAAGVVTLKKVTENLWGVWNIFVSPDYRRRGISLSLYEKSFAYLRKKGAKKAIGSVDVTNTPSRKSIKRVWDGFLSQKFYEYHGNISCIQKKSQKIPVRTFCSSDQSALFEMYKQCAHRDWYTFLEIDTDDFLQRLIENKYYSGSLRILLQEQILVFESEDKTLRGYAFAPTPRWPLRKPIEKVYFFLSPQLAPDEAVAIINEMLNLKARRGARKVRMFSINTNEKLLSETSKILCRDFSFKAFQHMVPIKKL